MRPDMTFMSSFAVLALATMCLPWHLSAQAAPQLSASVTVNTQQVIRTIPDTLFGTNVEWVWNGYGLWDEYRNQADPTLVNHAKAMGVTLLRYPGGMYSDFYHWQNGVGPNSSRPFVPFRVGDADTGRIAFGTDEALRFARDVNGELLITVNVGTGTAQEAAAWVRYVNSSGLKVRHWEVGNEVYIRDGSPAQLAINMDPATYANRYVSFARAMRAADPRIKIGAIGGVNRGPYSFVGYPAWNETVLSIAGADMDFLAIHNSYAPVNVRDSDDVRSVYSALLAAPLLIAGDLALVNQQIQTFAPHYAGKIAIAVTEWGPFFQNYHAGRFVQHSRTLGSALFAASTLKSFIESPRTQIANFHTFNDMSIMCWVCSRDSSFPPRPVWTQTAEAMAFQLIRSSLGTQLVSSVVNSPKYDSPAIGMISPVAGVPYLEVLSTLSADGRTLSLIVINKHIDQPIQTTLSLAGFLPATLGVVSTLRGTGIDANTGTSPLQVPGVYWGYQASDPVNPQFYNGGPGQVSIATNSVAAQSSFSYQFPARSITALRLTRR